MEFEVFRPKIDEKGREVHPGGLKNLVGKYYMDDDGVLKAIKKSDTHLYDRTLKIRTPIYCKEKDPHKVCHICVGQLANNRSKYANLGHLSAVTITAIITQSVLSTKHLTVSSTVNSIVLNPAYHGVLTLDDKRVNYLLNPNLKGKKVELIIKKKFLAGITKIVDINDINRLVSERISNIEHMYIKVDDVSTRINLTQENRKAILTKEFMYYIRKNLWEIDDDVNYIFNMGKWNYKHPLLTYANKEYNFGDHARLIAKIIESNTYSMEDRALEEKAEEVIKELFFVINSKMSINIAAIEIIVYALTIFNFWNNNYALGRNSSKLALGIYNKIMSNRSLSAQYLYKFQETTLVDPASFTNNNRPDHLLDVLFAPDEVVEHYKQKGQYKIT
jgi:hypothetical protein